MAGQVDVCRSLSLTVGQAFAVLATEEYWRACLRLAPEMCSELIEFTCDDTVVDVRTRSILPLDWLPGPVQRRLRAAPTLLRHERWTLHTPDAAWADITIDIDVARVAASAAGRGSLTARPPDGGLVDVHLELSVPVPVLGGVIEGLVVGRVEALVRREQALLERVFLERAFLERG